MQTAASNYNGLLTNNSATLYPVDSNGEDGMEEVFSKPTVSYEVTGPIEFLRLDITIYMGGAGYDGTVNEKVGNWEMMDRLFLKMAFRNLVLPLLCLRH